MLPVPTLLISGADRAAKTVFLRALLAKRPARERWAVLDNDDNLLAEDGQAHDLYIASVSGCACCTGQVSLQTGITRLLRESRPQGLVIIVAAAAEPAALTQTLQQQHLMAALRLVRSQCIAAATLQSAGESARGLWLRQMRAADDIVAVDDGAAAALRGPALRIIGTAEAIALALAGMAGTARS